jgi:hypothetical protein
MGDERRLNVKECWFHLQRVDEAISAGAINFTALYESREFFERQLERCLIREHYKEKKAMALNNPDVDVNETYGDGMGKSGNGAEQTGIAEKSLRYRDRFYQDSEPSGHSGLGGAEAEKVRG